MHEQLIGTNHVVAEELTLAPARTARRRAALVARLTLACALPLAQLSQLGAHSLALGAALLAQALALGALRRPSFALRGLRRQTRFSCFFSACSLGILGSGLRRTQAVARFTPRLGEACLRHLASKPNQTSYQAVDQTTRVTLEMIHYFPFRVSHGTPAVVKWMNGVLESTSSCDGALRAGSSSSQERTLALDESMVPRRRASRRPARKKRCAIPTGLTRWAPALARQRRHGFSLRDVSSP
ncbi:MAG TPA: hypothetical protein VFZ53_21075 [Polyangiaceae bacterium]